MKNRISILENKYDDIKIYIKEELKNKQDKFLFLQSNIIQTNDENVILSWFEKRPKKFHLLLDSKVDGDSTSTFYQRCENKKPTILFFKTTKGARFGGFTTQFWICSEKGAIRDDKSFVFSLDKREKYKVVSTKDALCCGKDFFQFGYCCFRIYNNCTSVNTNYIDNNKNYYDIPSNNGLTGGESQFTISSYEVYQIEY